MSIAIEQYAGNWPVLPLKRCGHFFAGAGFPLEEQGSYNQELPFFKVNALANALSNGELVADIDTIS